MNTELATIFVDETSEFANIQSPSPSIDFTDWKLTTDLVNSLTPNPNFLVSAPIPEHGYFEIQYMLANNFWGIPMNFGNSPAGTQIRQGIAHLIDKGKFANSEPALGGIATALDNPLPASNGGLPAPNPCAWDTLPNGNPSGANCIVGAPGGTAYHLGPAAGVTGHYAWQQATGSADFCVAAQHFINAGIATGKDATTCVLTGVTGLAASNPVAFFVRSDDPARLDLGNSLAEEICALFGAGFTINCTYLATTDGPITAFQGFQTSPTQVALTWHMYTAGYGFVYPFDQSLYFTYNSRFVSGTAGIQPPNGTCSSQAVPTSSAANYMYLCNTAYDSMSGKMEFANCLGSPGPTLDPQPGNTSNGPGANCNGTVGSTNLTGISAGVQAEDIYGKNAFSLPVFITSDQYAYLRNWSGAINNEGNGIPNYFTWLNAYNALPTQAGTIRQGFKQSTRSLNPYIASTIWDFYIIGNIYDSLGIANPLSNGQLLDWMTVATQQVPNNALTYTPPGGACNTPGGTCTVSTFRFTLRSDLFWHDGHRVSSWDAKFSYVTLLATGAFQGGQLAPMLGVTVISPQQFDVNVNAVGPFTKLSLTSPTIIPGRYWSVCSSTIWDGDVSRGNVPDSCMAVPSSKLTPTYDALANGILVGSGPWMCRSGTGIVGYGCSTGGVQNPQVGGSYTLTRFGIGTSPGGAISSTYFRSAGNLALWAWSLDNGDFTHDFLNFGVVAACFGQPAQPLGSTGPCPHFQQGIGANGGPISVGLNQVAIVNRFVGINWASPYNWAQLGPLGISSPAPVLHEGTATMNPASLVGCTTAYPAGGYDC